MLLLLLLLLLFIVVIALGFFGAIGSGKAMHVPPFGKSCLYSNTSSLDFLVDPSPSLRIRHGIRFR